MSYFNKKDKDEKESPLLPKISSFRKTSSFGKMSMFPKSAGSFISKLKSFSKKDIAMVVVGISTLTLAPVAEYFLSKPANENLLTPGFGDRGSFGSSSIYEPGINSLSEGFPDGVGDVVTPLSVRDPLSLIRGIKSNAPESPLAPPSNYRDSLKNVAKDSFSRASRSAGAPTVIPRMQGSLRGISSFMDSGATRTSGNISKGEMLAKAKKASSKAAGRSMTGPVASADYKGVASSPKGSSKDAMEQLRSRAGKSASHFTGGGAVDAVDKSAADAVNLKGSGGMGQGIKGDEYKSPTNSSTKNSSSHSRQKTLAETIAEMKAKAQAEEDIYLKHGIKKEIIQSFLDGVVKKGLIEPIGLLVAGATKSALGMGGSAPAKCWDPVNYNRSTGKWDPDMKKISPDQDNCSEYGATPSSIISGGEHSTAGSSTRHCICGEGPTPPHGYEYKSSSDGATENIVEENSDKVIEEIDMHLGVADEAVKRCRKDIDNEGTFNSIGELSRLKKEMRAIVDSLKNAREKSITLADKYIITPSQENSKMASKLSDDSNDVYVEALRIKPAIERGKTKISKATPLILKGNEGNQKKFYDIAQGCLPTNYEECITKAEGLGSDKAILGALMLGNCQVQFAWKSVNRAEDTGKKFNKRYKKAAEMSDVAQEKAVANKEELSEINSKLDEYSQGIQNANIELLKKYIEELSVTTTEKKPQQLNHELNYGVVSTLKDRWLSVPNNTSVIAQMRSIIGISATGKDWKERIKAEQDKETKWWEENNPFSNENYLKAKQQETSVSLIRLRNRAIKLAGDFSGNISTAKQSITEAVPIAEKAEKDVRTLVCGDKTTKKTEAEAEVKPENVYHNNDYCGETGPIPDTPPSPAPPTPGPVPQPVQPSPETSPLEKAKARVEKLINNSLSTNETIKKDAEAEVEKARTYIDNSNRLLCTTSECKGALEEAEKASKNMNDKFVEIKRLKEGLEKPGLDENAIKKIETNLETLNSEFEAYHDNFSGPDADLNGAIRTGEWCDKNNKGMAIVRCRMLIDNDLIIDNHNPNGNNGGQNEAGLDLIKKEAEAALWKINNVHSRAKGEITKF
ncbi:MAG: hypothetical protein KJ893_07460, partial [Candidatus Omnitrophica bacterium]|nr:hypothetical protein [Candidatus Omnitrophota bacterium]